MADDAALAALFGSAAARQAGKPNPYANLSGGETASSSSSSASASASASAGSSNAASSGASGAQRGKVADAPPADAADAARASLLAGADTRRKVEPPESTNAGPSSSDANAADSGPEIKGEMFEGDLEFDFQDLNLTAGAGVGSGAGSGADPASALDFAAIDEDLARFEQDELVRDALQRGVDLRLYSKQVDMELRQMEMLSIADCEST